MSLNTWFKERNNWHYLVGGLIEALCYMLTFQAYQMIGRFLISTIIVLFVACIWEMVREQKYGYAFDKKDVVRSVVGGIVAGIICVSIHVLIIGKFI